MMELSKLDLSVTGINNAMMGKDEYWKEAFELYNEGNDRLSMRCRPCYYKVYQFLKEYERNQQRKEE